MVLLVVVIVTNSGVSGGDSHGCGDECCGNEVDDVEPYHALHAHALHAHEPCELGLHVGAHAARPHGGQHLEGVPSTQGWGGGEWGLGGARNI